MRKDFPYLGESVYMDSACQSLRPAPVIEALNNYFTQYNACGERVKYAWGQKVDAQVSATRAAVLKMLKLREKDYFVSFTLNTTYGINLILNQLKVGGCRCEGYDCEVKGCDDNNKTGSLRCARDDNGLLIKKVMTSDIEHNSAFLASLAFSERHKISREIMTRADDGSIDISKYDFDGALVVVNVVSNFDGRKLSNVDELIKAVHRGGGIVVLDAAQGMTFGRELLVGTNADAICFSAHKMYGPSLGVMVVRRDMLSKLETNFIGGGMVDDVTGADSYVLSADSAGHAYTRFEPGLQAWGEIIALGAAIEWLETAEKSSQVDELSRQLYDFLANSPKIQLLNAEPTPILSFYHEKLGADLLAGALSNHGIMARDGYFCCHYYLGQVKDYPKLLRLSLGLHNNQADIDKVIEVMRRAVK